MKCSKCSQPMRALFTSMYCDCDAVPEPVTAEVTERIARCPMCCQSKSVRRMTSNGQCLCVSCAHWFVAGA